MTVTSAIAPNLNLKSSRHLAEANLRLVYAIAARLYTKLCGAMEYDDLVSLGTLGLMQAATRYDGSSSASFTTFAYYRIYGEMMDGVRAATPLPRTRWRKGAELDESHATVLERQLVRRGSWEVMSMHTRHAARGTPIGTAVMKPGACSASRTAAMLTRALNQLSAPERRLIRRYYYEDRKLSDVSRELSRSKAWSSRLHQRALSRLRDQLRDYSYDSLVG